jgi:hypothetical protein
MYNVVIKHKYAYLVLVLALGATAAILAFVTAPNGKSNPPFPFTSVTPGQIAPAGLTLSAPQASLPAQAVSALAASQAAHAFQGTAATALEAHFMHCVDTTAVPPINQDCYAVSVDPAGIQFAGFRNAPPAPATWGIVLVDPSGNPIETVGGSN